MRIIPKEVCRLLLGILVYLVGSQPMNGQGAALRLVSDTTCNGMVQLHVVAQQMPAINALTFAIPYDTLALTFDTLIRRYPRLDIGTFNPRHPTRGMVFSWFILDSVIFGTDTILTMRLSAAPNRGDTFNFEPNFFFCGLNNIPIPLSRFGCTWRSQGAEPPLSITPPLVQGNSGNSVLFSYTPGYCTDTIYFQWSRNDSFPQSLTTTIYVGRSQHLPAFWNHSFPGFNIPTGDSVLFWRWFAILRGDTAVGLINRLVFPSFGAYVPHLGEPQWWLYPNPSRGLLMLRGVAAKTAYLVDIRGRCYLKEVMGTSTPRDFFVFEDQAIELGDLPSGVYWLELYDDRNHFVGRRKVIRMLE